MKNNKTHFHHQTYPIYGIHYTSRLRWFTMKAQEFFENRFIVYILTLIRLVIIIPYKCVMTVIRFIAELGNSSSASH